MRPVIGWVNVPTAEHAVGVGQETAERSLKDELLFGGSSKNQLLPLPDVTVAADARDDLRGEPEGDRGPGLVVNPGHEDPRRPHRRQAGYRRRTDGRHANLTDLLAL